MTTFLLIRHGMIPTIPHSLTGRTPGVFLTEEGREQAARLGRWLRDRTIDAVYASPLERTQETAKALGRPVQTCEALLEIDFGKWRGATIAELDADPEWKLFNLFRSTRRIPGGEAMVEVQARVIGALERMRAAHPEGTVAVVTHADIIKTALTHYLGMSVDQFLRLDISPGSVSTVRVFDWGPVVDSINVMPPGCV